MDRSSIRAWRRIQKKRVWRNRIKYYANLRTTIIDGVHEGGIIPCDWKKYRKARWVHVLKTTATPCSCWMGCNYPYNREEYKRTTRRLLREQAED